MKNVSSILIVDDEASGRDTLEALLAKQGYQLAFATSGPEALVKAAELTPDLILLDVMMPGMDGFEVCRRLRGDPQLAEVPVIHLTALDDRDSRLRGIEAGADDFVSKPFDRDELRARVRTITRLNRYRRLLAADDRTREQAALLDQANDAIILENAQDRILYWNQGAARLYGWTAAEAADRSAGELLYREIPREFQEAHQTVIARGEWAGELRQVTKAGKEIVVASRWTLIRDQQGKPKSKLIINTDITEKKNLEAQYYRAQRMESIGTLAGGIAHDLNNVLTPILMAVDLLKTSVPEAQRLSFLDMLRASVQRGAALVQQILSFARGTEGELLPLHLVPVIKETRKLLEHSLPKSIQVEVNVPKDLWWVTGDGTQISQVLTNLCVNARDAMPAGGRLTIRAENILLDEHYASMHAEARPGPYVVLQVADTGTGIPPHILEKIFDPFFTTKEPGKGTGLGLSTVLGILRSHHGFITVSSDLGKGTCFAVHLPARKGADQEGCEQQQAPPKGRGELILVVDDEPHIRDMTKATLEAHGYLALTAGDGAEAVALYAEKRSEIRLVVLDMSMPIMDGPATIRALQRLNPDIRMIAISGFTAHGKLADRPNLGEKTFLQKPYTAQRLLQAVRDTLDAN